MDTVLIVIVVLLSVIGVLGTLAIRADRRLMKGRALMLNEIEGFNPEQTLLKSTGCAHTGISIDSTSKQVVLIVNETFALLPFSDVIAAEIITDGETVTRVSRSSQVAGMAVGGLLLGGVGAVVGGLSGTRTSTQKIKQVILRITVNNVDYPVHDIGFVEHGYMGATPGDLALAEASRWVGLLKVVMFQGRVEERTS